MELRSFWHRKKFELLSFKSFYIKNIRKKNDKVLTRIEFNGIVKEFYDRLTDKIVEGFQWALPYNMGMLYVVGRKYYPKQPEKGKMARVVDWKATLEYWKEDPKNKEDKIFIFYDNYHTDDFLFRIKWDKLVHSNITNKFVFKPMHPFKQKLVKKLKKGDYKNLQLAYE